MNRLVAATTGALKDSYESRADESPVQSPIFAHQQFERLEAEGGPRVAPALKKILRVLTEATQRGGNQSSH